MPLPPVCLGWQKPSPNRVNARSPWFTVAECLLYEGTPPEDYTPKGLKTRAQNSGGLLLKQDMYRGMFCTFVSNFFTFNFHFHSKSFIQR